MDFETWHHDLFEATYPSHRLGERLVLSYRMDGTVLVQWGDAVQTVSPLDVYESLKRPGSAIDDFTHWVWVNFPVQHDMERRNSYLCYDPVVRSYTAYVMRSPSVVQAVYNVDPKRWVSPKTLDDFQPVVEDHFVGSLIEVSPLTVIPACTTVVYPYVMQDIIEKHLDYNRDYHLAIPVDGKGSMFIGHQDSVNRLLLDYGDSHFSTTSLRKALKEHYGHTT